ncbi:quaternary amine ABC transporter ATP-binding protein [Hansschlegelia plantiphila]|uniref:Quaternary amine transport ATP-binding protein n=1 Tax=Hansschlegelia plantiphila TaxID=374655 RepID=A0A9W6MXB8_9HYPH|nr:glycine betaine/L-proline ABC transporter ATP-binding protein [Hansschlegelia plantiphila]GLK69745.1 ABC transporter ATP-binding protein [Hansschlegelia plantiphila]
MTDKARSTKLACRNVWKVFGEGAERAFAKPVQRSLEARLAALRDGGHVPAVADVSFDVAEGECLVIMGLSGSGKSTLVRCLSRLVEPTSGEVIFEGRDLMRLSRRELTEVRRHKMGMVFQAFGLLPHLTVLENVAFPLQVQGVGEAERRKRALEMVGLVGLAGREDAYPRQLSGGQQQRVGIARSLAVGPDLWFLDEPFSALDPLIRKQMQDEFLRLQRTLRKTIVFITHDFLEALKIADRVVIMRDGRVVQIGRPADLVLNPADEYVARFVADVPLLRVITAGDVEEPVGGACAAHGGVSRSTPIEALLARLADVAAVPITEDGALVGQVTSAGVMKAVAAASARADRGWTVERA